MPASTKSFSNLEVVEVSREPSQGLPPRYIPGDSRNPLPEVVPRLTQQHIAQDATLPNTDRFTLPRRPEEYAVFDSTTAPRPSFWRRHWMLILIFVALCVGAIVGGVVGGIRYGHVTNPISPPTASAANTAGTDSSNAAVTTTVTLDVVTMSTAGSNTGSVMTSTTTLTTVVVPLPTTAVSTVTQTAQQATFTAVYEGAGIGGYDLKFSTDQSFAFDYDHSGKLDHIVMYRPGYGVVYILKNDNGVFTTVYPTQRDGTSGIGGYDLRSGADRVFAFDYDHSGKLDHLVLYRPGTGAIFIVTNQNGVFSPVYKQGAPGLGIGGYDLLSQDDEVFAFDYDHSGNMDHVVLIRPGTGTIWILKNENGVFSPVYQQGDPGSGIAGYDLLSRADKAFAFDYDHTGRLDHLVLYRPGTGAFCIAKNTGGAFTLVYAQGDPGKGIGGYDLLDPADSAFSFDFEGSGKRDYLVLYRPGSGIIEILKNDNGAFSPMYGVQDAGSGVGGFALNSTHDAAYAFDYGDTGKLDHMVLYEPGAMTVYIVARQT